MRTVIRFTRVWRCRVMRNRCAYDPRCQTSTCREGAINKVADPKAVGNFGAGIGVPRPS